MGDQFNMATSGVFSAIVKITLKTHTFNRILDKFEVSHLKYIHGMQ
jgi:hypothetical protein